MVDAPINTAETWPNHPVKSVPVTFEYCGITVKMVPIKLHFDMAAMTYFLVGYESHTGRLVRYPMNKIENWRAS